MDKKLQNKLYSEYPRILKDLGGDPTETCMSWSHGGISCGDGWFDLLEKVFNFCQFNTDKNGYPQLVVDQIKEKFGSLRIYHHFEESEFDIVKKFNRNQEYSNGAIDFAEYMSFFICEDCGKPGKRRTIGWVRVACDDCDEKYKRNLYD